MLLSTEPFDGEVDAEEAGVFTLTDEGLHTAVDVLVLFEAWWSSKRFTTLRASVRPGADMLRPNMSLKVARVRENLLGNEYWLIQKLRSDTRKKTSNSPRRNFLCLVFICFHQRPRESCISTVQETPLRKNPEIIPSSAFIGVYLLVSVIGPRNEWTIRT